MDVVFRDGPEGFGGGLADQSEPVGEVCQMVYPLPACAWLGQAFPYGPQDPRAVGRLETVDQLVLLLPKVGAVLPHQLGGIAHHLGDGRLQVGRVGVVRPCLEDVLPGVGPRGERRLIHGIGQLRGGRRVARVGGGQAGQGVVDDDGPALLVADDAQIVSEWDVAEPWPGVNVAKLIKPPSIRREEARVLTIEEAKSLLDAIKDDRLEAFWICALTLGLRRGELLGLRWQDVDFENGLLAVRQSLQRADGSLQFVDPKTDRSRRVVPVPEPTLAALRKHKRAQAVEKLASGERWKDHGLVFASTIGTPIEPGNLSTRWRAARKKAGLDWLRLHDLRHACASYLLACGALPRTVMKTLGHSQIALTMNTYTHVLPDIERTAVEAVAKKLFG
jgi:integrase